MPDTHQPNHATSLSEGHIEAQYSVMKKKNLHKSS